MVVAEEALPVAAVFHTQLSTAEFHSLSQAFDGRLYLFVTGQPLAEVTSREVSLPVLERGFIVCTAAQALFH